MDFESTKRLGLDKYCIDLSKSYETYDPAYNNHIINIYLKKDYELKCPNCLVKEIKIIGTRKNILFHSVISQKICKIILNRRKYKCQICNHIFTEPNKLSNQTNKSYSMEIEILNSLKNINKSYKEVAKEYGVSEYYVRDLFDRKVDLKRNELPEVLCIDEVYNKRLTKYKYCCILYSPQRRQIIDVLNTRHKNYLYDYFARISNTEKQKVRYISIDLWDSYREIGYKCFPNTLVCADSFHVIKHIIEAFKKIRIRIQNKYKDTRNEETFSYYWLLKKYNYLLTSTKKRDNFKPRKISHTRMYMTANDLIHFMLKISDELRLAYELLSAYQIFNQNASIDDAYPWLEDLISKFKLSRIPEYIEIWKLLENWKVEIINSFNKVNGHRISNGPMERVNRDIKTLYRTSYGMKNFTRTRNRIMFCINQNAPTLGVKKAFNNNRKLKKKD